jgi:hypothetical protein
MWAAFVILCGLNVAVFLVYNAIVIDLDSVVNEFMDRYEPMSVTPPPEGLINQPGLVFFKTHKTAGSTVSRILFRKFCRDERRHCFLPSESNPGRTWNLNDEQELRYILAPFSNDGNGPIDVWLHHAIYSPILMTDIVPNSRNKMMSIVRRPCGRFQSAWQWYSLHNLTSASADDREVQSLFEFTSFIHESIRPYVPAVSLISAVANIMYSFHYRTGLDATTMELLGITSNSVFLLRSASEFAQLMQRLQRNELLLLVADRFDESIVAFGHILHGWPLHQLFYFKNKVASYRDELELNDLLGEDLDSIQPFDYALYRVANYMLDKFLASDDHFDSVEEKLLLYERGLKQVTEFCAGLTDTIQDPSMCIDGASFKSFADIASVVDSAPVACSANYSHKNNHDAAIVERFESAMESVRNSSYEISHDEILKDRHSLAKIVSWNMCRSLAMDNREAVLTQWKIRRSIQFSPPSTGVTNRTRLGAIRTALALEDMLLSTFIT